MPQSKGKILVVEDEEDLVDILSSVLEGEGYEVEHALNGSDGLQKLKSFTPDLILLDMNMPKMGGVSFYHEIYDRAREQSRFPVLFLTGRTEMEELLLDLHADGFISKPFKVDDVLGKVAAIIGRKSSMLPSASSGEPGRRSSSATVFIVEYDPTTLGAITVQFLGGGYGVTASENAEAALQKLAEDRPDVLLLRHDMPDMPGDMLAYKLRQIAHLKETPLILYSPRIHLEESHLTDEICKQLNIERPLEGADPRRLLEKADRAIRRGPAAGNSAS